MSAPRRAKTGGRTIGTKNKVSASVQDRLKVLKCDPIEQLVIIARQAQANDDLQLAVTVYKDLAAYVAPKLKSIELIESVAPPEKLEVIFTRAVRPPITAPNEKVGFSE